jgi:hypothetical protein
MSELFHFEDLQKESKTEKERKSDSCLEVLAKHIDEYAKFYESDFVRDSASDRFGFPEDERAKVGKIIQEVKNKILEMYEKDSNLNVEIEGQAGHIFGNSILLYAGGTAERYAKGKTVPEERRKKIREDMNLLNYYASELSADDKLLQDELIFEKGYLRNFERFFKGEIRPESPSRIALLKFFRELEKGIKKEEFSKRLEDIDKATGMEKFLDLQELERNGLLLVDNKGEEYYKLV